MSKYLESVPEERRGTLVALRDLCGEILTAFEESMDYGMPSYKRDGTVEVAFASQKNYISLYVLRQDVLDTHRDRLAGVKYGKGCIRYSSPEKVDLGVVKAMLEATAASRGPIC